MPFSYPTIVEKIATCEFYTGIYQQRHPILVPSTMTTQGIDNDLNADLNNLYAAVQAFLDKAMNYLEGGKTGIGPTKLRCYRDSINCVCSIGKTQQPPLQAAFSHYGTSD